MVDSFYFEGVEDGGDVSFELHVDDGSDDLFGMRGTCEI